MSDKIAVIGLGYVGLPLARLFATRYRVVGFDINSQRIDELRRGIDSYRQEDETALRAVLDCNSEHSGLTLTNNEDDIDGCNCFIVTVPTPVDDNNHPDLSPLLAASATVGRHIGSATAGRHTGSGATVIYESTVYPGITERRCVPVIEQVSGLKFNVDFFAGYSPERINPGDREHSVERIRKITSGSTPEAAERVDALYRSVIAAGTHRAPNIRVAEAAKVIENSQRDINIAFVNELAKIFNLIGIDTGEVIEAAATKWNFLPFHPGLVGGHCIGVDPYYLAECAQAAGYHPEIILAGRRLNDSMGQFVANETVRLMLKKRIRMDGARALILGFTFKENCPDIRNTKVIDIVHTLEEYGIETVISDPWADAAEAQREYDIKILNSVPDSRFDAIILAVAHGEFAALDINRLKATKSVIYDVKGTLPKEICDGRL
jgi:UDP-N-acetyl-D-galactosamine dehydrogenase